KGDSTGLLLGAALGTLAQYGRDKLTLVFPPAWRPFGDWLEQLIAESLGKEGKGIVPVLNEPPLETQVYGKDRIFVFFEDDPGRWDDSRKTELATAGHPLLILPVGDAYDLGGQMFLWEMATAVAGHLLGVNPFDQPDVEATKEHTSRMIAGYRKTRVWPLAEPALAVAGGEVYGDVSGSDIAHALANFLAQAQDGAYVGLQVYLSPSSEIDAALARLRAALTRRCKLAVTVGYGPRYLHSTGQLHKGDAGRGLFLQLTGDGAADLPIPDELGEAASTLTFGELKAAQAEADRQALLDQGRKVLRIHWKQDPPAGLNALADSLQP
ncbi:MAG: hypothetical protein KA113_16235, partial [Syntrophaceae bacterium]|nr:hypothetical protein [Syntrophaceae bacterium]